MKASPYRRYLLVILMVILAFNNVDRLALGLVLQNIKTDLHLSDTQLGLLTGIAFAFFYAIMGIPIARWADRGNRVTIISLTVAMWSVMVAITGRAANFVQLLLIRSAVAVGEAGCVPPANSLIPEYFPRAERPRAAGVYLAGGYLSVLIGYFIAGWLSQFFGWRTMFMMLGLPGLVLAVLAKLTLREPRLAGIPAAGSKRDGDIETTGRRECETAGGLTPRAASPSMREVSKRLWATITFRHLVASFSVASFFGSGISQWQPSYFIRSYGLTSGELGTWFGMMNGVMALVGISMGGIVATRYAAHNERLQFRVMAAGCAIFSLIYSGVYLVHNYYINFGFIGLGALGFAALIGPLYGAVQSIVPPEMRAISIAILTMFASLIGLGLGPLVIGVISDALRPVFGQESLRFALLAMCPGYVWAGWHLWCASKSVTRDIEMSRGRAEGASECAVPS